MFNDQIFNQIFFYIHYIIILIINQRYKRLFEANDPGKGGSFYLQSKVFRSKEVLENEISKTNEKKSEV